MNWWDLPGPSRFVTEIADDLREGTNVVVCCPEHTPTALRQSVLREFGNCELHVIRAGSERPMNLLFQRFVPNAPSTTLRDTASFIEQLDGRARLVFIEAVSPGTWPDWDAFLREYQHACGQVSVLNRTLFCISPPAVLAQHFSNGDIRLRVHRYDGYVGPIDSLVYAATTLAQFGLNSLERDIAIAVIARIGLWDPYVIERLSVQPLSIMLNPCEVLYDIAEERRWAGSVDWASGSSSTFNGAKVTHSAALPPGSPELRRRIWSAEVGVVLPRIEELRQEFLIRYASRFRMPHRTRFGELIEDVRDLEIGHICSQLRRIGAPVDDRLSAEQLTEARNQLSHLEPLDPVLLKAVANGAVASD